MANFAYKCLLDKVSPGTRIETGAANRQSPAQGSDLDRDMSFILTFQSSTNAIIFRQFLLKIVETGDASDAGVYDAAFAAMNTANLA